jgi:hypothetical protein
VKRLAIAPAARRRSRCGEPSSSTLIGAITGT